MNRVFTFLFLASLLFISAQLHAQSDLKKNQKSIEKLIRGYNEQHYKTVKRSFGFLAKIFATKKSIMGNYLEPRHKNYGKIVRFDPPVKAGIRTYVFPVIYENDSTIPEYLALTFTKKNKITSLYFSPDNIILPKLDSTSTIKKLATPYVNFKDHYNLQLAIGIFNNDKKDFYAFNGDSVSITTTDSTLYQIGSISKLFTGILLANSINKGYVDSTANISTFLKSKVAYKKTEPNLIHLAQHTSGFPREPDNLNQTIIDDNNPFSNYTATDLNNYLNNSKLVSSPGKAYRYSNLGMGLLAYILVKERNQLYEELLNQEICTPLKMANTTTTPDSTKIVQSYYRGHPTVDFSFQEPLIGAGGIYSSIRDLLKFIEANISPESTTISADLNLASRPRKVNKYISLGYAWEVSSIDVNGEVIEVWEHSGNTLGSSSILLYSKKRKIGVVILANSGIPVDELGTKIFLGLVKKYL